MAFKILKKINTAALVGLLTMSSAFNAYAGPGELPKIPIYNTNLGVEPNIYFTIDDSGSMAWELSFKEGATGFPTDQGRPRVNGHLRSYMIPGWRSGNSLMPAYSFDVLNDNHQYWIFYTPDGNSIYYDYSLDYFPWSGKDEDDNNMYADANPTSVKEKPNDAANDKDNLDITKNVSKRYIPLYCTWDDDKTDNGLSSDDDHTCYEIKSGNTFPSGRSYEDELQNFANWLQYYRKREYAAKQAIGQVMNATNEARMGLSFINSDTKRNLKTMTDDDNKRDLLETYYADGSSGTTPLRAALHSTGQMFMGNNAILPEEQGGECQQNFNILMTDGYWNGNAPSGFGNEDGDADTIFDGDADNSVDQGNYADSASSTLADIAMYYYENDLRDDLADRVPVSPGVDLAPHQHLVYDRFRSYRHPGSQHSPDR